MSLPSCWSACGAVHPTDRIRGEHGTDTKFSGRWLVALVSDTGMRLAEGAGLLKSDITLDAEIPHINLKPNLPGCCVFTKEQASPEGQINSSFPLRLQRHCMLLAGLAGSLGILQLCW